jgi:hypothetical protein
MGDGEIGKGQIEEEGYEETFHCLIQTKEKCRFTVPPGVALLNYISSGILYPIFCQTGTFRGVFSISNNAVRISAAAMGGAGGGDIILIKKNKTKKNLGHTLGPIL